MRWYHVWMTSYIYVNSQKENKLWVDNFMTKLMFEPTDTDVLWEFQNKGKAS